VPPLVTEWTSGGESWSVTTVAEPNETLEAQTRRHNEAVAYWQGIAPPDEED